MERRFLRERYDAHMPAPAPNDPTTPYPQLVNVVTNILQFTRRLDFKGARGVHVGGGLLTTKWARAAYS